MTGNADTFVDAIRIFHKLLIPFFCPCLILNFGITGNVRNDGTAYFLQSFFKFFKRAIILNKLIWFVYFQFCLVKSKKFSLHVLTVCNNLLNRLLLTGGTSFRFGPGKGVIMYKWLDYYPSPKIDNLVLGFITTKRNALLLRVTGNVLNQKPNFLELAIVSGIRGS